MSRILNTLAGRLVLFQLLAYLALLPLLFASLERANRASTTQTFTRNAHAYATSLARELELGDVLDSASRTVKFLDGGVEGGGCRYAALEYNGRLLGSSVSETPPWVQSRASDPAFSSRADGTYAVSVPFHRAAVAGILYLGFDKEPTNAQLRAARDLILSALVAYGVASLLVTALLARFVTKPLTQLQTASRRVASGDVTVRLATRSRLHEIAGLTSDLENMRTELVGTADRLRAEITQRQVEHQERAVLEQQLRHEQRLATIGTFASGLAHEFNNILVPLILYTEEALDELGPHAVRWNLERVLAAGTRASSVVSKMLAFSRPVAQRHLELVELAAVTREALDFSKALIPENITLVERIGGAGKFVRADATLLTQVLLNLCSNAVHAMRASGGTLEVTLRNVIGHAGQGAPEMLELSVKDSGHGMTPETRERIFEPFYTTREVGEGSGLGLAIVHGIIISLSGTIDVTSAPGLGSEFVVRLPVADAKPSAQ